jgi:hypothetical protein
MRSVIVPADPHPRSDGIAAILVLANDREPFHIAMSLAFNWSAANTARAHTCEEDLLTEILGRKQRYPKTQQRWTRVDLKLYATLPYGSTAPMPDALMFGGWISSVGDKLDRLFVEVKERDGQMVAITGGREHITVEGRPLTAFCS